LGWFKGGISTKEHWANDYWVKNLNENKEGNLDFCDNIWIEKYINIFNKIKKGQALDLGCGIGQYTKYLKDKRFNVISLDISEVALEKLKKTISDAITINLDMSQQLPFDDNTFELIVANLSIHYFDRNNTIKLLKEIHRVLKKDGYFIGSVNSITGYEKWILSSTEIEKNYYYKNGKYNRLWTKEQFQEFFDNFMFLVLEEAEIKRWNSIKIQWQFIAKGIK
jgi:ubiquinone/menaquinone biosynthesis C-methylase UbiE